MVLEVVLLEPTLSEVCDATGLFVDPVASVCLGTVGVKLPEGLLFSTLRGTNTGGFDLAFLVGSPL